MLQALIIAGREAGNRYVVARRKIVHTILVLSENHRSFAKRYASVFALLLATGCTNIGSHDSYFINGLAGPVAGRGLVSLASNYPNARVFTRISPIAYRYEIAPKIARQIMLDHSRGTLQRPLVLVGHSYGCRTASIIAAKLDEENIKVDYLACVDGLPMPIRRNVIMADNFRPKKKSWGRALSRHEGQQATQIREFSIADCNHIDVMSSKHVTKRLKQQIALASR